MIVRFESRPPQSQPGPRGQGVTATAAWTASSAGTLMPFALAPLLALWVVANKK